MKILHALFVLPIAFLPAIITLAENGAPIVRVTAPADGAGLPAGEKFTASAEARAEDGRRIVKVEFFVQSHARRVGEAVAEPFTVEVTSHKFAKARFSITARATDDKGAATDSEPVWVRMNDDANHPPRAAVREERFISRHVAGSGHEGIPSLVEMPNGDLLCAFYAGRYELSHDTSIRLTRLARGAAEWDDPRIIIGGDDGIPRANPVLLLGKDGALTCFYASIEGGQAFEFARPRFRVSRDGGATWGAEQRMPEQKFEQPTGTVFALKPIRLADGTILLPANRESYDPKRGWTSFFYRSTDEGQTWTETPEIHSKPGNIQPTAQQLAVKAGNVAAGSLVALFRPRGRDGKLWRSTSTDGGKTWLPLEKTPLDNPSSRSDFVALPGGALVLACNPSPQMRTPVSLLLSRDGGKTWPIRRDIETGPGPYGYCAVIRTRDGKIHVAYDCDRRVIKHAVVDEAWFDEPPRMLDYVRP